MKEIIRAEIIRYISESVENWSAETKDHYYDEPLIQYASADDSLFEEYKKLLYPEHLTPKEAFELAFGQGTYSGGTVISILLPINEKIRISNRPQTEGPSKEWALFNSFGHLFLPKLAEHIETYLNKQGYRTVAPTIAKWFVMKPFGPDLALGSNWSERHIAYAAGLGTFSLNEGFISEKGIAVRLLSVVTGLKLTPDSRTDRPYNANCLFFSKGTCGVCIKRCPAGALSQEGHDKTKCRSFAYGDEMKKLAASYGGKPGTSAGCSLCQTNVPCEFRPPIH
ncbi:(Fe-S)-binding protein [Sporomusa sp. KB1]|jgi:ferredoxin|uniref:(Fe-S)-binding protein n=1 Tax=Sporomusa sp. KB1 TaxID=943346 RepID=UPI00119CDF02|nr:(Fe-S)-binding protein [Sporomusa sp. KB1]TWH51920.1 epoxyqueuosine reductase QueG [Sporomusa sp. KB1]